MSLKWSILNIFNLRMLSRFNPTNLLHPSRLLNHWLLMSKMKNHKSLLAKSKRVNLVKSRLNSHWSLKWELSRHNLKRKFVTTMSKKIVLWLMQTPA